MSEKIYYDFDPFKETGAELPEGANKNDVLQAASEFLVEQVLTHVGNKNSPVQGHGAFKGLSKEYRKFKKASGHPGVPNLEFSGEMLAALEATVKGSKIRLQIQGSQAPKADGHCNHSGASLLPERVFIPRADESFKKPIIDGIRRIILEAGFK